MARRVFVPAGIAVALALALAAVTPAPAAQGRPSGPARLPAVHPAPQSMHEHGGPVPLGASVELVTGPAGDPAAISALRAVLERAGVRHVDTNGTADGTARETAIFVGGAAENPATADALRSLGVADASGLAAEGYVLAAGTVHDRPAIVLDGRDPTGTFYAVQTLRQLIERRGDHAVVPGVVVTDWPAQAVRGVIEGFYGTPWSDEQRLAQLDFYGAHKMNSYVYSPKDDPYLRAQWRDPYPPAQLDQIKALVDRAIANHVEFTYALSPGLSVCYSSAADEQALAAKFQTLWDIGVRTFSVPLDDISYTKWNCAADKAKWGTGGGAAGAAQAYLLNALQKDFIATHPGASRLEMVPTEYSNVTPSAYKTAIKNDLDPAVIVGWTGVGVIAPTITTTQAAAAKSVFGHDILLWDNYPVNDYVTDRLLLGPYTGRESGLSGELYGTTANPMIQPEASKIALFSVADFTWNSAAFDPESSWQASLSELAGHDRQARKALAAFADLEHYSRIDTVQAPVLAALVDDFWPAWERGDAAAARALDSYLAIVEAIPATLRSRMHDAEFVDETQPWLDSAGAWGDAARAALRMLVDERAGRPAAALADRELAEAKQAQAKAYTYSGLRGDVRVSVGDGVIDTFIAAALDENDRWLGIAGRRVMPMTSLPTYQTYAPGNMVDGDLSTPFWSSRAPKAGDYVGVDLGIARPITSVSVLGGDAQSPEDYLHLAALEYSTDGTTWTTAGTYANTPHVSATLPPGTKARYVRLRATAADGDWVKVPEFTVTGPTNETLTVSGTPAPAAGSSLAAAADGDVDSAYAAGSTPKNGDALVVTLPEPRAVDRVGIVGTGEATVEGDVDGVWQRLGRLAAGGYAELDAAGRTMSAIRLSWMPGSQPPTVSEVVPWYADTAPAALTVTPASSDTAVHIPVQLSVQLTATQPRDLTGLLRAAAPDGLAVTPPARRHTVLRGSQQSIPLTARSGRAGSYPVTVTFAVRRAAPASGSAVVTVHPAVSATNVAASAEGANATASSVEQNLPQFSPGFAIDGDATTRWSSEHTDPEWLQVEFAGAQHLGKVVIDWEAAHARSYRLETSSDGRNWTTAATVTDSPGGNETVWLDQAGVTYLRVQGVARATAYGYSIYELQAYPIAG